MVSKQVGDHWSSIGYLIVTGLSLRFQVAGYLLLVAGEVASSHGAPPPSLPQEVFEVQLLPFSKTHYRPPKAIVIKSSKEYNYHKRFYDDHVFIKENYNILRH